MNNQDKQQIFGARLILLLAIHAVYIAGKQHSSCNSKSKHNERERSFLFYVDRFFDKKILDDISWLGGSNLTSLDAKNLMLELIEKDNIFAFSSENVVVSDFQIKSFDILEYDVRKKRDDKPSLLSSFEIIPDDANPESYDVIHKKIFTINYNETQFNRYVDVFYNEENVKNVVVESFPVGEIEDESEANSWFYGAIAWLIQIYEHLELSNNVFGEDFFANDGIVVQARQFYLSCLNEYNDKRLEQQNKMNEILEKELVKTDNFSKLLKDIFQWKFFQKQINFTFLLH